jgi:hypothetical protein
MDCSSYLHGSRIPITFPTFPHSLDLNLSKPGTTAAIDEKRGPVYPLVAYTQCIFATQSLNREALDDDSHQEMSSVVNKERHVGQKDMPGGPMSGYASAS